MRIINEIVLHCSATKEYRVYTIKDIEYMHKRIFKEIGGCHCGYHYLIYLDGTIIQTKQLKFIGQHVAGHNIDTIGICYIGGCDISGKPKDTRTTAQKQSIIRLLKELKEKYPKAIIKGHRDYSPDKNNDGVISQFERIKECPCFDAITEYSKL